MFEDQAKSNVPGNLPVEPDDMFAGVEKENSMPQSEMPPAVPNALSAGLLKKKDDPVMTQSTAMPLAAQSMYEMKQPILGKILLFVLVAIILGGVGFGGWYVYNKFVKVQPIDTGANVTAVPLETKPVVNEPITPPVVDVVAPVVVTTSEVTAGMNNDKILFGQTVDSDADGLDDIREQQLGTNISKSDTDSDGLNDYDEVMIWKTDSLNPDTDGDGYKDGEEVKNGYNPLGPGKLLNSSSPTSTPAAATSTTGSVI